MKGYLQRLVQTASKPAESVHPWAGSIFAGHQSNFNVVEPEESAPITANTLSPEVMSPTSAPSFQALVPPETLPLGVERNPPIAPMALGLPHARQSRGASFSEKIVPEPLIGNEQSAGLAMDSTALEMTPTQKPEMALPPRGRHSQAGVDAAIKSGNTRRPALGSSLARKENTDARGARNSVAPDPQTDEIQIHIGRIEVTAIHPPAPARPKARDKELSLDAYLKRRDGRAG
jgi:hypothetical protein